MPAFGGDTVSIGGSSGASSAPAPSVAPISAPSAFKGSTVSIGQSITPSAPSAFKGSTVSTTTSPTTISTSTPALNIPSLVSSVKPVNTSNLFSGFKSMNNLTVPKTDDSTPQLPGQNVGIDTSPASKIAADTLSGLGDASTKFSNAINDAVIQKPADLLSNTPFIKQASAGIESGSFAGNFAQSVLQHLSVGLSSISGLTGGGYQMPNLNTGDNPDLVTKGLTTLANGIGMAVSIGTIGKIISGIGVTGEIVGKLTSLTENMPLVAKYIAPYLQPLIDNVASFSIYGQLDPNLGANIKDRATKLLTDIGTAPLYTALGAINNPIYSLPASFGLGYGMAKLSGETNQNAASAGAAFAFLDAFGRATGERGLNPNQIEQDRQNESLDILSKNSGMKLNKDSTLDDFKKAYHLAAHQTHPDVGGVSKDFEAVKSAFDFLSKGVASKSQGNVTEPEKSIAFLKGEINDSTENNGTELTHQALQDNLGIDEPTADRLMRGAIIPHTPEEIDTKNQEVLNQVIPQDRAPKTIFEASQRYIKDVVTPSIKEGKAVMIGADDLKYHFGKDFDPQHHLIYSHAANNVLLEAAHAVDNPTIYFTAGGPGSGKSEILTKSLSKNFDGIIYDTNLMNLKGALSQIHMLQDIGKKVQVHFMLTDLQQARAFTLIREKEGGHAVSLSGFSNNHAKVPRVLEELIKDGVDVVIHDARGKEFSPEDIRNIKPSKNPIDTLKELTYTKDDVSNLVKNITHENARTFTRSTEGNVSQGSENRINSEGKAVGSGQGGRVFQNTQGGFINPSQVVQDVADKVKEITELVNKNAETSKLTGTVNDAIYQHEGGRKANRQRLVNLINEVGDDLSAQGWENLYHYDEDNSVKLTKEEKEIYDTVIKPLKEALRKARAQYRKLGGVITRDIMDEHTPRFVKEKGGPIDKILQLVDRTKKNLSNGSLLGKSLGSGSKSRQFHIAIKDNKQRTVIHVGTGKNAKVTAFEDGVPRNLGKINRQTRESLLKEEIKPVQEKIRQVQDSIDSIISKDTARTPVVDSKINSLNKEIDELIKYVDSKVGVYTSKELAPEVRAIQKKSIEYNALSQVKQSIDQQKINRSARLETLKSQMVELTNKLGSIENKYNPDQLDERVFQDEQGNQYKIGQATTKEIEANTKVQYHKNALANYVISFDRTLNALNALKLLNRIKDTPEFGEIIKKDDPDEAPPEKWVSVGDILPQFRGYHMDPKLGETLTDLANRQKGRTYFPIIDEINNILTTAIVFNPIMHFPNIAQGFGMAAAGTGRIPGLSSNSRKNFITALNEVKNTGPLYLSYIEHGAPFMALKETAKNFTDAILTQYSEEVKTNPNEFTALSKALGYANPVAWAKGLGKINDAITWGGNDVLFMHALMDYADKNGTSIEESIKEVSKRMADYRIPSRIGPGKFGRALSQTLQSRAFMFSRYHVSGVIKPWIENIKDSADPRSTGKQRMAGLRSLAYLALMGLIIYPFLDKLLQGITGSKNTYLTMSGPVKGIQIAQKLGAAGSTGIPAAVQSTVSLSPVITAGLELGFNTDLYSRNPIYGPLPAEGMTQFGISMLSPLASANRMSPGDFALSMFGIYTPKDSAGKTALLAQKYDELPALQVQVKKDLADGNTAKADAEMKDFNDRAIANYNQDQIKSGGTPLPADGSQNAAFLKQWGIKAPGAKALGNASALYGNGDLTSKSSLISNVVTYAEAIGTDPITAFNRIFTGQAITRVDSPGFLNPDGAIIVQRMPEATSEAIREEDAPKQGYTQAQLSGLQLDHIIPLEAGGTNDPSNLDLITTEQNQTLNALAETPIATALKNGEISRANVREYLIRYKIGTLHEATTPEIQQEYKDDYGSKPITVDQITKLIDSGKAK